MFGRKPRKTNDTVTVREAALGLIARRRYTEAELASRLGRKGYGEEEIAGAMAWLRELKYLDDAALARESAALAVRQHVGPARVAARLRGRGVDRQTVAGASDAAFEGVDLRDSARAALRRRFGRAALAEAGPADRKRASNFLFRMGFDWDTIRAVLKSDAADE